MKEKLEKLINELSLIPDEKWRSNRLGEYKTKHNEQRIIIYNNHNGSGDCFPVIRICKKGFLAPNETSKKKLKTLIYRLYNFYKDPIKKKDKEEKLEILERILNPKYMNDVFTWNQIIKAFKKIFLI